MSRKGLQEKYNLPKSIKVVMEKSEHGIYAYLPDYPGCMTLAKSFSELIGNITDAVLTYFEVPRSEAKKVDLIYLPRIPRRSPSIIGSRSKPQHQPVKFVSVSPQYLYA